MDRVAEKKCLEVALAFAKELKFDDLRVVSTRGVPSHPSEGAGQAGELSARPVGEECLEVIMALSYDPATCGQLTANRGPADAEAMAAFLEGGFRIRILANESSVISHNWEDIQLS